MFRLCFQFIVFSSSWSYVKAQCYATPEISTSFASYENLEIQTNLGDLAEKILKDLITISSEIPICNEEKEYCIATLETCVDTDSLIHPDKLDEFKEHFGNLIALDFTYSYLVNR